MAVTEQSGSLTAIERGVGLLTAIFVYDEDADEGAEEAFYSTVKEMVPDEESSEAVALALIAIASICGPLLDHCAACYEMDKYELLQGMAQELYRSLD